MVITTLSEGALIKRINRNLRHEDQVLKKSRARSVQGYVYFDQNFGEFYILDFMRNNLIAAHVDVEALGRELGVLGAHEQVET